MKRIGIDARLYFQTGVGTYIRNLLHYLELQPHREVEFFVYVLPEDAQKIAFSSLSFIKRVAPYKWHTVNEQVGFARLLYQDKLDLMHFTYIGHPVLYNRKFIATIHDTTLFSGKTGEASTKNSLIYEIKHVGFRFAFSHQLTKSASIIVPTTTIKNQIVELFGSQYESKITVTYEGVDYELMNAKEDKNLEKEFGGPFFLYVGNFYPHKNVENLIKAFAQTNIDTKLILRGRYDYFTQRIEELITSLHQEKRIIIHPNYSYSEMVFFYKHAKALIHPSLSEGLGLPLIEAAYFNLPIIASDIPVFKELLNDTYISFNPLDVLDIKNKLESFSRQPRKPSYQKLLTKFSFEKMASDTLKLYLENLS